MRMRIDVIVRRHPVVVRNLQDTPYDKRVERRQQLYRIANLGVVHPAHTAYAITNEIRPVSLTAHMNR